MKALKKTWANKTASSMLGRVIVERLQKRLKSLLYELRELSQRKSINETIETEAQIAMIRNASAPARLRTKTLGEEPSN